MIPLDYICIQYWSFSDSFMSDLSFNTFLRPSVFIFDSQGELGNAIQNGESQGKFSLMFWRQRSCSIVHL